MCFTKFFSLFCLITMVSLVVFSEAQSIPVQQGLDQTAQKVDTRLSVPLTFDADQMYLGELLEKVSAKTGVSISTPITEPSSGIPITCHVNKVPLIDFMNSIWSLVGFSRATWQISSDVQPGNRSYRLVPTASALTLSKRLNVETDQYTLKLLKMYLDIQAVAPSERKAQVHQFAKAMLLDDELVARQILQDNPGMNQYWSEFRLFSTELSTEQQEQVLQGKTISLPISALSSTGQEVVSMLAGHSTLTRNGVETEVHPDTLRFSFTKYLGNKKHMMSNLCIGVGNAVGFMTSDYLASMELGLANYIFNGWILPGDIRRTDVEGTTVKGLPALPPETIWSHAAPVDRLLTQFADAQNVSYIGVVPDDARVGTEISVGRSAEQYLSDLKTQSGLMHKWRDGVLLFNTPLWFYGDDAQYPYKIVKQLRTSHEQDAGRPLSFQAIAGAVTTLSDVQIKRLAKEFPEVERNKTKRPVFVLYEKYPKMLGDDGVTIDLNMLATMQMLKVMPPIADKETLTRIRIIEQPNTQIKDGRRVYKIQVQTMRQGEWQDVGILTILPF